MTGSCEGCYLYTYDDKGPWKDGKPVPFEIGDELIGTLTIGFGHTGPEVVAGMRTTQEQADKWLLEDVKEAEEGVKRCVTVPLKQSEYDSCTDQIFNTGETKFKTSTMLSRLNAGEYDKAGEAILMWYKTKGLEHGMLKRCAARYALFMGLPWERAKDAVTKAMTGNMMGGIISISMAAKNLLEVAQRQRDDEIRALELLNSKPEPPEPTEPEPVIDPPVASPEPVVTAPKPEPKEAVVVSEPIKPTPGILAQTKPASVYTKTFEQVNYGIDGNLGLKPLDESDRARGYFWQRLGSGIIEAGAKGALGTGSAGIFTFIAGTEAFTEMALYLFVMGGIAGGTLVSGYVTKAYGNWKRQKGEEEASQALF